MRILQATAPPAASWSIYLQDINQIAQIVGVVLIIFYVIYTYKTFRQIKKQTDYQQDAFLFVEPFFLNEIIEQNDVSMSRLKNSFLSRKRNLNTKYLEKELPEKMSEILKPIFNFEDNLYEGNFYSVNLINYGNAEVKQTILNLKVTIGNSKEVAEMKMLREKETHNLRVVIPEIISRNGGKVEIPIISTASFPIYSISLNGEYYDVRDKKYIIPESIQTGENKHFHFLEKNTSSIIN